jgi:hypothetical protein
MNESQVIASLTARVTTDSAVAQAVNSDNNNSGEIIVTLVRGCSRDGGSAAVRAMSAGGAARDPQCGRPSETQAISQVGGSQPGRPQEKLPEFTAVASNSASWSRRGGWLVIKIRAKYLVRGDVGQSGWVCLHSAPLEAAEFIPHPNPVAMNIPNAD